jgi:hypothetical protein
MQLCSLHRVRPQIYISFIVCAYNLYPFLAAAVAGINDMSEQQKLAALRLLFFFPYRTHTITDCQQFPAA